MTHLFPAGRRSRNGVTGLLITGAICAAVLTPPVGDVALRISSRA